MDRALAAEIVSRELAAYRVRPYDQLLDLLDRQEVREVKLGGRTYQLEFQALWDDREKGYLRVMGAIDDGGWRVFLPLTDDFIVAPDGTLVGE